MADKQKFLLQTIRKWIDEEQLGKLDAALSEAQRRSPLPNRVLEGLALAAIEGGSDEALEICLRHHPKAKDDQTLRMLCEEAAARECLGACLLLVEAGLDPGARFLAFKGRIHAHQRNEEPGVAQPRLWARPNRWSRQEEVSLLDWAIGRTKSADPSEEFAFVRELIERGGEMTPARWVALWSSTGLDGLDLALEKGVDLLAPHPLPGTRAVNGQPIFGNALEAWLRSATKGELDGWRLAQAGVDRMLPVGGPDLWKAADPRVASQPIHLLWHRAGVASQKAGASARLKKDEGEAAAAVESMMMWLLSQEADSSEPDAHGRPVIHHAMSRFAADGEETYFLDEVTPLAKLAMSVCPIEWLKPHLERMEGHPDLATARGVFTQRERDELAESASGLSFSGGSGAPEGGRKPKPGGRRL